MEEGENGVWAVNLQPAMKTISSFMNINASLSQGKCYMYSLLSCRHVVIYLFNKDH